MNLGSICSGIEAATAALKPIGYNPIWYSEIERFPSDLLSVKYSSTPNLGDFTKIKDQILRGTLEIPDILCGGTPCQAFSLAGLQRGLNDERGLLTLEFVKLVRAMDHVLTSCRRKPFVLWENVEGILNSKSNVFGHFVSAILGLDSLFPNKKWCRSGVIFGPSRNVAWRVLDAKYFGIPHQRRRVFLLATDPSIDPSAIMFEPNFERVHLTPRSLYTAQSLSSDPHNISSNLHNISSLAGDHLRFDKELRFTLNNGDHIEVFRSYTDCLYSAYGTKWNGNAAAYNGSLFVSQNERIRRLTPLEVERLMGFEDDYTKIDKCSHTARYKAVGNSWAVSVVRWIGERIKDRSEERLLLGVLDHVNTNQEMILINNHSINVSTAPIKYKRGDLKEIISSSPLEKFYLSKKGIKGILRRAEEKRIKMNERLKSIMLTQIR